MIALVGFLLLCGGSVVSVHAMRESRWSVTAMAFAFGLLGLWLMVGNLGGI